MAQSDLKFGPKSKGRALMWFEKVLLRGREKENAKGQLKPQERSVWGKEKRKASKS